MEIKEWVMRKLIVLCLIALISVIPVFAENTGTIGSSTPTDSIKVSLDLGAVNSATVGFSSSEVTNFASSTALTEGANKLQPSSADGKAKLANDIYAYAKIQYPQTCYVTIKADDAMIGYRNSNRDELGSTVKLGWKIIDKEDEADLLDITYDAQNNNVSGAGSKLIFTHDGSAAATKVYSLPINIETYDYRGLAANYFEQTLTIVVSTDSPATGA